MANPLLSPEEVQRLRTKGEPRAITKAKRRKAEERHRVETKKAVFARDGGKCRVCGKRATEMHELQFRSLGGERSLTNSIAVCTFQGNNCHRLLQGHAIEVEGTNANRRLVFRWADHITAEQRVFRILSKRRSQRDDARGSRRSVPATVGADRDVAR